MTARRSLSCLSLVLLLASCAPLPTAMSKKGPPRSDKPATSASPGVEPTGLPGTNPGTTTPAVPQPPAIISDNGASLTGLVKAPADLVSKVKLLSNNGGSLVGNNSSNRRVLALDQAPLANMTVRLVDAAGQAIPGPDGKPLTAVTDAQGRYGFQSVLPTQNVLVEVLLPEGLGAVQAIVPKGAKLVDADLVSTLTTGYIVNQYVKPQQDAVGTLQKLPADVEAATRDRARLALEGGAAAVPESLTAERVVATVDAMRAKDSNFDSQMVTVQKLLIAAGVSNLGAGLPATEVYLPRMFDSDVAADGTIYTYVSDDKLLWRIGTDGRLQAAAGNGERANEGAKASRSGLKATDFALNHVWRVELDSLERPMVCENNSGIWRLEPNGTVTELHAQTALEAAFGNGFVGRGLDLRDDGTLVIIADDALWALPPGGAKSKLADAPGVRAIDGLVEMVKGERWLASAWGSLNEVKVGQAPVTHFLQDDPKILIAPWGSAYTASLDKRGNYFYFSAADRKLHQRKPDGSDTALADYPFDTRSFAWTLTGKDSKLYLSDAVTKGNQGTVLRRLDGPNADGTIVAGMAGPPRGFSADGRIPLLKPAGMDVGPDGTVWVADAGAILELPPGGVPRVLAEPKTAIPPLFEMVDFTGVRRLASGRLAARGLGKTNEYILVQDDAGQWTLGLSNKRTYGNEWNVTMHAWDAAPDGTLVASVHRYNNATSQQEAHLIRRKPGEAIGTIFVPVSEGLSDIAKLTFGADGQLYMRAAKGLLGKPLRYRIDDAGKLTALEEGAIVPEAKDGAGRVYEGDASTFTFGNFGDRHIRRKAANGAAETIAGQGTALLGGTSLDDSIGWAEDLRFDTAGNLYIRDAVRRQIRRVPKDRL